MSRAWWLATVTGLVLASGAMGQDAAWRFQWQAGQTLKYQVEQNFSVTETADGKTTELKVKLSNTKNWKIIGVDQAGVATMELTMSSLHMEQTTPAGETLTFDSSSPDKSTPQLRDQVAKYIGQRLALLRVDGTGKVIEVKESNYGPASRYESMPPFVIVLPGRSLAQGETWSRDYNVTLDPPAGTGEAYPATQSYKCRIVQGPQSIIDFATTIKNPPASVADQVPLLEKQTVGAVLFNTPAGRMEQAKIVVNKELKGHRGEGSSYRFQSTYTEKYVP
ncbi:MAG TPA: hypothetical protein VFA18_21730 [Gemmataceae bacterium]|nr:hypothetical protein [Gemmataceae bacterium]